MEQLQKIKEAGISVEWRQDEMAHRYLAKDFQESAYLAMAKKDLTKEMRNFLEDIWYYGCLSKKQAIGQYQLKLEQLQRLTRNDKVAKHRVGRYTFYTLTSFGAVLIDVEDYVVNYWLLD